MGALTWWLSPHPEWDAGEDWPELVPVVRYETDEAVVVIDPLPPPDGPFDPGGQPVQVLLTQPSHYRATAVFVERHGASVWTPPRAVWHQRADPATKTDLPTGVEAIDLDGEPQQVLFFIREHGTLVSGDVLTGRDGVMQVFADEGERVPLLASLGRTAELPVARVIVPHCEEPVFLDGSERIRAAVADARAAS